MGNAIFVRNGGDSDVGLIADQASQAESFHLSVE